MAMSRLDPVQIKALEFGRGKRGVGYALEMGLGKTLLILAEFTDLVAARMVTRLVVVAPNTFKPGWIEEIEKHGLDLDAHIFVSGSKQNDKWLAKRYTRPPVLIVNYEAIRSEAVLLKIMVWMRIKPSLLTLDESIQIKTHDAQQTRAALKLTQDAKIVRFLSGLPQTQGPHDLYPQLRAIGLFQGQKFWAFRNTFCVMGGWENKQVVGVKNADQLARIMAPVVFQARKVDWLPELPRKDYTTRAYEMSGEQAAQYQQMHDEFLLELKNNEIVAVDVAVSKYEKLSQIQCGFILNEQGEPRVLVEPEKNPRLTVLLDLLSQIEGKTVVIYRHRYSFEILEQALAAYKPAHIKGGMKPDELTREKKAFNTREDCRVMLGQCDAIKYGHTLLGVREPENHCSTMIFFESSYSLDTRTQDEDRIHRRGQWANCLYIDLCGSELDRRVTRALQQKENLYEAVFSKLRLAEPVDE